MPVATYALRDWVGVLLEIHDGFGYLDVNRLDHHLDVEWPQKSFDNPIHLNCNKDL